MNAASATTVLWWPGRLLAEDDLRRHWTSQREIVLSPKTIVTPLALDFLKGKRIAIRREEKVSDAGAPMGVVWGIVEETSSPLVDAAMNALNQEGRSLSILSGSGEWIARLRGIATKLANGNPPGVVVVSEQPGLAACIANKTSGVRAASVSQAAEVVALREMLGPNMFVLTTTGRTFFELRQLLKTATASPPICPVPMSKTLREVDGHAHR